MTVEDQLLEMTAEDPALWLALLAWDGPSAAMVWVREHCPPNLHTHPRMAEAGRLLQQLAGQP